MLTRSLPSLALLLALARSPQAAGQAVTPIQHLDQIQYNGTWYEIARLPAKREKKCVADPVQLVAPGDKPNSFLYVNACKDKDGYNDTWNNTGRTNKASTGAIRLPRLLIFHRPYWVLAAAPDYSWTLLGTPNHQSLWIYSKTVTLSSETLATIKSQAVAQGFSMDKLIFTPQSVRIPTPRYSGTSDTPINQPPR